ncbi:MAG: DUF222 domain-containing protein [Myxococcales bacterium]|nr:DUF222 domain-containing protein [Myxococcales bacterium]
MLDGAIEPCQPGAGPQPDIPEDLEALEDALTQLAGHLNAAEHRFLLLLERFDRTDGNLGFGLKSTAHWLNWKCGIALGAARERVRVARALPGLPQINEAFARGELSYSKVRAMTRVATPGNEDYLMMIAQHGTASQLELLIRGYRRALRAEETERAKEQHAERELRCWYDDDGALVIRGRLAPEQGALFLKALEAAGDSLRDEAYAEEAGRAADAPPPDHATRQADALLRIAETALAHEPTAMPAGERYQVVVHVDADTLPENGPGLRCHVEGGPRVSAETSRRLSCDCSKVVVHAHLDGEILDIGRKSRQIPPAIRRALRLRDHGCRFPGCTERRYVDGHHIIHWSDGGPTSLQNLVLLCRYHHRLVHEGGFSVTRDHERIRFHTPDGGQLPPAPQHRAPEGIGASELERTHQQLGLSIDAQTAVTRWNGDRMDVPRAVEGLCQLTQH